MKEGKDLVARAGKFTNELLELLREIPDWLKDDRQLSRQVRRLALARQIDETIQKVDKRRKSAYIGYGKRPWVFLAPERRFAVTGMDDDDKRAWELAKAMGYPSLPYEAFIETMKKLRSRVLEGRADEMVDKPFPEVVRSVVRRGGGRIRRRVREK